MFAVVDQADAFGKHHGGGGGCGYTDYAASYNSCGPTMSVSYVKQAMTSYQPVWKSKAVTVPVQKLVSSTQQVPYEYYETVPNWKTVTQNVTQYQAKQVPVEYYETVPTWNTVTQNVTTYQCKQVPTEYYENVPTWNTVTQNVTQYQCKQVPT